MLTRGIDVRLVENMHTVMNLGAKTPFSLHDIIHVPFDQFEHYNDHFTHPIYKTLISVKDTRLPSINF